MENALELKNVTKEYKDFTLDNVTLSIPKGCIMGLIGENGAGKSTMIKLILQIAKKDFGTITILGHDNSGDISSIKENIGVVMDEPSFSAEMNAKNVNIIMKNIFKTWNEEKYASWLKEFGLPEKKKVKDYSRGMKMKLSLAVALSHDSRLLILDEATSGLDPIVRDEILDVFMNFIQNEENSILISSHITSDLEKVCDYITFLHRGKVIMSEGKDEMLDKYGILKCSTDEFELADESAVLGVRKNKFGIEALVERDRIRGDFLIERASLEDIMLFTTRGEK